MKRQKRSKDRPENGDRTENGQCTNVTNRRSRLGVSRRSRVGVNYVIPSFRISVDFPSFRLLGFWEIFRRSVF